MVQISRTTPRSPNGRVDEPAWLRHMHARYPSPEQTTLLQKTLQCLEQAAPHEYYPHWSCRDAGLEMASILTELNASLDTVCAALLHPFVLKHTLSLDQVRKTCGDDITGLLKGVQQMREVLYDDHELSKAIDFEGLRKMLLAMINDVRVVLVRLVEQVCLMRIAKELPADVQVILANQTLAVYAPLANRLGIGQIKWELEDRAFFFVNPSAYKQITSELHEKRIDREAYIQHIVEEVGQALQAAHITGEVTGRPKHIYSIWRKMHQKDLSFDQLFDIRAIRILVRDIATCYGALGIVNHLYQVRPQEFTDYIAMPKSNGYQSIHTVVEGPENKLIEIQIRTYAMHEEAEMGIAAHWCYKEGAKHDSHFSQRVNWFRSLIAWQKELAGQEEGFGQAHTRVMDEYVYVFTPVGDVVALPKGSTPIDLAYAVHTQVGHRCRGAKINGTIVPLTYKLQTGERVEIITGSESRPSRDWIVANSEYVCAARTRNKIAHYFRTENREEHIRRGKEIFSKSAQKRSFSIAELEKATKRFNFKEVDDLYASISFGDLKPQVIINYIDGKADEPSPTAQHDIQLGWQNLIDTPINANNSHDMVVHGIDNVLTHTAGCCRPVKGDDIIGYITQGQGVSVHRMGCADLTRLRVVAPERLVPVNWGDNVKSAPAQLRVLAQADVNVLKGITQYCAQEKLDIMSLNSQQRRDRTMLIDITLIVESKEQLERIRNQMAQVQHVASVERI